MPTETGQNMENVPGTLPEVNPLSDLFLNHRRIQNSLWESNDNDKVDYFNNREGQRYWVRFNTNQESRGNLNLNQGYGG